jgi:hypothetical protein
MGPIKSLNQIILLFIETIKQARRLGIWLLLLCYFFVIWLLLYAHYKFLSPVFYPLISTWISVFGKDNFAAFSHYPGQFLYLPYFFGWAKLLLGFLVEGLVLGGVAAMFADGYRNIAGRNRMSFKDIFSLWFHLLMVWVVINFLTVSVNFYLPDLLEFFHQGSPRRLMAVRYLILPFVLSVILALFFYAIPAVVMFRDNFLKALGRSLGLFFRRPITSFILAALVMFVPYYISAVPPDVLISKFRPELVYWVILLGLAAELLADYFWMGLSVRFLIEEEGT